MVEDFSHYSNCPEDRIETRVVGHGRESTTRYRASGCGNGIEYVCRDLDGACFSPMITVARRHAKQFGCDLSEVTCEYLDGGSWQAEGCGHTMTYHCFESEEVTLRCIAETDDRRRSMVE